MSQNEEITTGDVVCLKSDKSDNYGRTFTVGSTSTATEVYIHWLSQGEFKSAKVNKYALHKIK